MFTTKVYGAQHFNVLNKIDVDNRVAKFLMTGQE